MSRRRGRVCRRSRVQGEYNKGRIVKARDCDYLFWERENLRQVQRQILCELRVVRETPGIAIDGLLGNDDVV